MNGLPYYKAYPRDFIEGTIGMPFEVKCAYRVVLDLIYLQGGRLPDDPRYISGNLGCSIRKWKSIRDHLIQIGKIHVSGEFLTNKRADNELETLSKYRENQAENARKPRKSKGLEKPPQSQRALKPEPEPEPKRDTNVSLARDAREDEFARFWEIVPRKKGKGAAEKAFAKARKIASLAEIIDGMERYARQREGQDPQYTCHPATWLNQKRWTDEHDHTQADFHREVEKMLGDRDGIQRKGEIDHHEPQQLSAPVPAPDASGHGRQLDRDQDDSRGDQQSHLSLIKPRRFG